jgi:starvation-inducible DNA-binding protein
MIEHSDRDLVHEELQNQLRDLLSLAVVGDHVRWVVVGNDAEQLADWLADAVLEWRALGDRVSRQLVRLGVAPDRRVRSLAKDIPLNWVPEGWLSSDEAGHLVADRLDTLAEWARFRQSQAIDPDTVQVLDDVSSSLETQARAARAILADSPRAERLSGA